MENPCKKYSVKYYYSSWSFSPDFPDDMNHLNTRSGSTRRIWSSGWQRAACNSNSHQPWLCLSVSSFYPLFSTQKVTKNHVLKCVSWSRADIKERCFLVCRRQFREEKGQADWFVKFFLSDGRDAIDSCIMNPVFPSGAEHWFSCFSFCSNLWFQRFSWNSNSCIWWLKNYFKY